MADKHRAPVALVTGGARRIGRAIAERLSVSGYSIAVHSSARSSTDAAALCDAIAARGGHAALVIADLAEPDDVAGLIAAAARAFGPLSLLVNNASVFLPDDSATFDDAQLAEHLAINLQAPLALSRAFAAQARGLDNPSIVNILDQRVLRPNPLYFTYAISKSALWHATKTMAQTFAPAVRVNGVGPGPVLPNANDGADVFEAEIASIPLMRATDPTEIADAVAWLAQARSVTGQMIAVDGGQHLAWRTPDVIAGGG